MISDNKGLEQKKAIQSRSVARSIARSEKDNACDYEILTKNEIRTLLKFTSNSECHAACLLRLSLFLGRSIEALLDKSCEYITPKVGSNFDGYGFIVVRREYPHLHLPDAVTKGLDNKGYVPIPKELSKCFAEIKSDELTELETQNLIERAKTLLRDINSQSTCRLTRGRIARYFSFYQSHFNKSEVIYGVIAGKEMQHHAGAYYTVIQSVQIVEMLEGYADYLSDKSEKPLFDLPTPLNNKHWGSLRATTPSEVSNYFIALRKQCEAAANARNIIDSSNHYLAYTLALLELSTGHRPENDAFGTIEMFNLEGGLLLVDDKESLSNHLRVVTLCDTAFKQLKYYIEHLHALRTLSRGLYPHLFSGVAEILNSRKPLLCYISDERFQHDALLKLSKETIKIATPGVRNYYRHVLKTHFESVSFPSDLIDQFLGHESKRDHSWSRFSSLTVKDSIAVSIEIENMLNEMGITSFESPLKRWL